VLLLNQDRHNTDPIFPVAQETHCGQRRWHVLAGGRHPCWPPAAKIDLVKAKVLPRRHRECATVPYLARQLPVFCRPTSKFIRLSRCSRKTMVKSKRHEDLYWFRVERYVRSQRWSSVCSSLECFEVLTMGVQE
jgi:hypothetical protein